MKRWTVRILAGIGAFAIGLVVLITLVAVFSGGPEGVPDRVVLEIDFEKPIAEYLPDDPFSILRRRDRMVLRDIVDALVRASQDDRVVALSARIGSAPMGFARIQELRDAVEAFRQSGKPAIAWSETFGEFGPGNGGFYLATAFDEILLQPSGDVGLTGLMMAHPFVKGTLEKVGMVPQMDHRREYKSMMNLFTEEGFTPAHREETESLVNALYGQFVQGIAEGRELTEDDVRSRIDGGPYLGSEAVVAGLIDGLAYRDELDTELDRRFDDPESITIAQYAKRTQPESEGKPVALIYGAGAVARGESQGDPLFGQVMGSETVTRAFRSAIEDDAVEAILFRVDSPGGSYVASDAVWRETVRAKEKGKPVIVSMGDVAGSGGYFVAMSADRIVAHPGTLTGSIGVVAGKVLTREMWSKLGLSWDDVRAGEHASMFSELHPYSSGEWQRFQEWLDRIYDDFTGKVAEGRGMTRDAVEEVARGRVWTGDQAMANGLVDTLGGFSVALACVREALELGPDHPLDLRPFPPHRSFVESLVSTLTGESILLLPGADRLLRAIEPVARISRELGLAGSAGVLQMQPVQLKM